MKHPQFHKQHRPSSSKVKAPQLQFVSLRVKLLLGFSVVFSVVFAGAFYWFYTFTTDKALLRLTEDMRSTLRGAAAGVDVEELLDLYAEGQPNAQGFSDDPRFKRQLAWFEAVHAIEPRAWLYSAIIRKPGSTESISQPIPPLDQLEMVYLVDLWASHDPSKAVRFLEADVPSRRALEAIAQEKLVEHPTIYRDRWGSWLSASIPLFNDQGEVVAVLGLDIEADYILQLQQSIRDRVWISFLATYGVLFVLLYILSGVLTQHLQALTQSAERIAAGDYNQGLSMVNPPFPDELHRLAQVFDVMVESIRVREHVIREGKQVEYEMRVALQEEKELSELKSRFISMVSHEFRTPLTVIRTSIELLERYGHIATEEKKREYFQRIRAAVRNMSHLMEDVLTIGKAEAGKLELLPITINLEQFCHDLVEEIQLGVGPGHTICFSSQGECQQAYLDQKLLRSILTNLLSNAIKYSPSGGKIEFNLVCRYEIAHFEIRDYGIGIPYADQPHLFELFHRASNAANIRGTGLGLAIVKQGVDLHGGKITFTSQEGIGTTFHVHLPLNGQPLLKV